MDLCSLQNTVHTISVFRIIEIRGHTNQSYNGNTTKLLELLPRSWRWVKAQKSTPHNA